MAVLAVSEKEMAELVTGAPDDIALGLIFEKFIKPLLVRLSMAGLGMKEARGVNTKAAQLVIDEWKEYQARQKQRPVRVIEHDDSSALMWVPAERTS